MNYSQQKSPFNTFMRAPLMTDNQYTRLSDFILSQLRKIYFLSISVRTCLQLYQGKVGGKSDGKIITARAAF